MSVDSGVGDGASPVVLLVVPYGIVGGAEQWAAGVLDAWPEERRRRVRAVTLGHGPAVDALRRRGVTTTVLPVGPGAFDLARAVPRLARLARGVDVVWANGLKSALVAAPARALGGAPVVWVKHDLSFDASLARPLGRAVREVVAVSDVAAAAVRRDDVTIVPPPLPAAPARPRDEARRVLDGLAGGSPEERLAIMVCRLSGYKRVEDAIRALPAAPGWRLLVVGGADPGEPGERERLEAVVDAVGLADRVVFAGPVADAGSLLGGADATLVLTAPDGSGRGGESWSLVALEALWAGSPLVGTVSGLPTTTPAARVVRERDPDAVAAALRSLEQPAAREELASRGARLLADHPDASSVAASLARVLDRAARGSRAVAVGSRPMDDRPAVTVVTTVLDERDAVEGLVRELLAQALPQDEIVVVDGGSRDGTRELLAEIAVDDARVRLVDAPGTNIPTGRNRGIAAATHRVVCCTDAGCRPLPGWLDALRAPFERADAPDLVTGIYRVEAESAWQAAFVHTGYPHPDDARGQRTIVRWWSRLFGRSWDPAMPTGRSVAFTVAAWERVGGFPEHLDTGEDVTFGRRIAQGGPAELAPDAQVVWAQRPTLAATARMYYRYGQGGGRGDDVKVIGRDVVRVAAYATLPWFASTRPRRGVAAVLGAVYVSVPLVRAVRDDGVVVAAMVPFATVLRDLAKAAGMLDGLRTRGRGRTTPS